ncbi:MAG: sugar transferase [Candidatus Delongbacteria bacterium]|jgi:undecaprenyl phosphate N,N'-diacetylbacillosamine 1-phosphate transferase|nr:sugar transferase [Candidatus Delongbacteria bacterium]
MNNKKLYLVFKRIFDVIFALVLLVFTFPILLLIVILIKIESKGPIFFKQKRLGKKGKVFEIYKFRTMIDGAIKTGSGLRTKANDPRITKIGNIIRKTSFDEIPQIINILKGQMSFIGPRPPVPYHPRKYEEYSEEQKIRFTVKPGISGYAQIVLRNSGTWDERFVYDIEYVKKISLGFDFYIFFMTIYSILVKKDIYLSKESEHKIPDRIDHVE